MEKKIEAGRWWERRFGDGCMLSSGVGKTMAPESGFASL